MRSNFEVGLFLHDDNAYIRTCTYACTRLLSFSRFARQQGQADLLYTFLFDDVHA